MKVIYDVAIVGAGPAGAIAAKTAAAAGLRVVLFERLDRPSHPVRCGEGVGLKGMAISVGIKPEWILSTVTKVKMVSPAGIEVELDDIGQSYVINREIFDNDLLKEAVTAGAELHTQTTIDRCERRADNIYTLHSRAESFSARCVICADGVESRVARSLGWNTALSLEDIETCAFARVKHESVVSDVIEFHIGNNLTPYGYVWVFPRGDGFANVGLGVLGSHHKPGLAKTLLDRFIEKRFGSAEVTHRHVGGVPVGAWLAPLVRGGAMIAGDAARQVNALNGGGIAYALYAGKTAAEAAIDAFTGGTFDETKLSFYEKNWRKYCGKQQKRSYALKTFLYRKNNDEFYDSIARHFALRPKGKLGYMRVFLKTFAENPIMMLKTFFLFR